MEIILQHLSFFFKRALWSEYYEADNRGLVDLAEAGFRPGPSSLENMTEGHRYSALHCGSR